MSSISAVSAVTAYAPDLAAAMLDSPRLASPMQAASVSAEGPRIGPGSRRWEPAGFALPLDTMMGPAAFSRDSTLAAGLRAAAPLQRVASGDPAVRQYQAPAAASGRFAYGPFLDGAADDKVMPPVDQGDTYTCGPASLTMIMNYLGVPVTSDGIEDEIQRVNYTGIGPQPMIDYARENGLNAEGYNNGSWDEIKRHVERGVAVQALIGTRFAHYVAVIGFRSNPATGEEQIGYRDSLAGGRVLWDSRAEFEDRWAFKEEWDDFSFLGYDNFFIAYAPPGTGLPQGRWDGVEGVTAMASGISHLAHHLDRIVHPDSVGSFVRGLMGLPSSLAHTVGGAASFGVQAVGRWLDEKAGDIPVLGWAARPVGKLLNGIGAGVANFIGGVGDGLDRVGTAVEKLFRGDGSGFVHGLSGAVRKVFGGASDALGSLWDGVADAAKNVGDTVVDTVKDVGNAIGKGVKSVGKFISKLS